MQRYYFLAFFMISFSFSLLSQVTDVSYQLKYNEEECVYDGYLIINEGSHANHIFYSMQFSSQFSIVVPTGTTVTMVERHNPKQGNWPLGSGTLPTFWQIGASVYDPPAMPGYDILAIYPNTSPSSRYTTASMGEEIKLFSLSCSPMTHGEDGIRLFENEVDPNSTELGGPNFSNGFTMGSINQIYGNNRPTVLPTEYASAETDGTPQVGETVTLVGHSGGTWENLTPEIIQLNGNTATLLTTGFVDLRYNLPNGQCQEKVHFLVEESTGEPAPEEEIGNTGIGTATPDISAVLDVSAANRGILTTRLSFVERNNFPSPIDGMLVYQNDKEKGFYYYDNGNWQKLDDVLERHLPQGVNIDNIVQSDQQSELRLTEQVNQLEQELELNRLKIKTLSELLEK